MIIGLAGPAGSGKDTVADYLVAQHGFTKLSFAGPLKAMLKAGGFPEPADRALKEAIIDGFDFSWREAAQKLGTEFGRGLDPDIWVKVVERGLVARDHDNTGRWVISDVRFENEGTMIRKRGGAVWHLMNRKANLGSASAHASEKGVQFFPTRDLLLDNSGDMQSLQMQINAEMLARTHALHMVAK